MTDRELMQQALDALKELNETNSYWWQEVDEATLAQMDAAITALEARLAHCDRCGKRLGGEGDIHTCTPPAAQKDEALKLALEVMHNQGDVGVDEWIAAKAAIKQALAAPVQPEQEPETCSNCANSVWPYGFCDVCTVQFDDPTTSNWEPITAATQRKPLTPMQPLVDVNGVTRFRKNGLVDALYEHGVKTGLSLNELHCMEFTDEDRMQFAQLIGYSLNGYGELSYVTDDAYEAAEQAAHGIKEKNNG